MRKFQAEFGVNDTVYIIRFDYGQFVAQLGTVVGVYFTFDNTTYMVDTVDATNWYYASDVFKTQEDVLEECRIRNHEEE